jgi:hypothetical protein
VPPLRAGDVHHLAVLDTPKQCATAANNGHRSTEWNYMLGARHNQAATLTSLAQCFVDEIEALWEVGHQVCAGGVLDLQDHVGEQQRVAREQALRDLRGVGWGGEEWC